MSSVLSPLRYPGGKSKIAPLITYILNEKTNKKIQTYIEPFAGGAGVALDLLLNKTVDEIIINDYDKAIYSFWKAVLNETAKFINTIESTPVTVEEWNRQKRIYLLQKNKYSFELGFATFFLNRTNRSGILNAGPIGGYKQEGAYPIDARFNKEELIDRIKKIALYKQHIKVYNKDIRSFIKHVISDNYANSFIYFDPPYYVKGKELYINYFMPKDHIEIYDAIIQNVKCMWIMTYDNNENISNIYANHLIKKYNLNYSLANKGKSSELVIFSDNSLCPSNKELETAKIKIKLL